MRLDIEGKELQKKISQALPFIAKGAFGSPNFLLEANAKGVAALSATSGETGLRSKLEATNVLAGKVCVPAVLLAQFVSRLSDATVTLRTDDDAPFNLHVESGGYRCVIRGSDPDDFTQLAKAGPTTIETGYTSLAFANACGTVDYACSTDDTKGALCGLRLHVEAGRLTLAATDGYRCAENTLPLHAYAGPEREVVVPKAALVTILHALAKDDQPLTLAISETRIVFVTPTYVAASAIIALPFPKYERVFAPFDQGTVTLPRKELANMIAAAAVFQGEKVKALALSVTHEGIGIATAAEAEMGESTIAYGCQVDGLLEPLRLGFSAKDVGQALEAISTDKVIIGLCGLRKPIWIKAPGNDQLRTIVIPLGLGGAA